MGWTFGIFVGVGVGELDGCIDGENEGEIEGKLEGAIRVTLCENNACIVQTKACKNTHPKWEESQGNGLAHYVDREWGRRLA